MSEKKGYWVRVPFTGYISVHVESKEELDADSAFELAMDAIDDCGYVLVDKYEKDHPANPSCDEFEYVPHVTQGNVTHAVLNDVDWEDG